MLRLEVSTFGKVLEHVVFISQQQLGQVNTVRKHSQAPQNGINKSEPATRVRSPNHTTLREILNLDHGRLLREVGRLAKKNWTWFAKQIKCFLQKSPRPFVRSSWFMIQWRQGVGFWCLQYLACSCFPRIFLVCAPCCQELLGVSTGDLRLVLDVFGISAKAESLLG